MSSKNKPKNNNVLDEIIYRREQEQKKIIEAKKKIAMMEATVQDTQGEIDKMKDESNKFLKALYFCDDPAVKKRIEKLMKEIEQIEQTQQAEEVQQTEEIQLPIADTSADEEKPPFDYNSYLKSNNDTLEE